MGPVPFRPPACGPCVDLLHGFLGEAGSCALAGVGVLASGVWCLVSEAGRGVPASGCGVLGARVSGFVCCRRVRVVGVDSRGSVRTELSAVCVCSLRAYAVPYAQLPNGVVELWSDSGVSRETRHLVTEELFVEAADFVILPWSRRNWHECRLA